VGSREDVMGKVMGAALAFFVVVQAAIYVIEPFREGYSDGFQDCVLNKPNFYLELEKKVK
jgi:hypothetical protein